MNGLIYDVFASLIRVTNFLILIRCVLSFSPVNNGSTFSRLIYDLTEPLLAPIRKMLFNSPLGGQGMMLDFSPVFLMILLEALLKLLQSILF